MNTSIEDQTSEKENDSNELKTDNARYRDRPLPNGEPNLSSDASTSESDSEPENTGNIKLLSPSRRKSVSKNNSSNDSDKDSEVEHNTSAESGLKLAVNSDNNRLETCANKSSSPSSTEGVREKCTPEIPPHVPSPLPVLQESGSDCVSDSISDEVPSLPPDICTPHSIESLECHKSVEDPLVEDVHLKKSQDTMESESHSGALTFDDGNDNNEQHNFPCDTSDNTLKLNETGLSSGLTDTSALASSSIVAEMENEDLENDMDDCDEIDNNSMGDIPSDDNLNGFDTDSSTREALRATENLEQVIAAEFESSIEQTDENAATTIPTEPIVQRDEGNMQIDNITNVASVGSVHSSHSANIPSVEPPVQQTEHPLPSPRHPHPSPHNIVSPHHPSPHQPGPSPHLPSPHHTMSPHHTLSPHHNVSPQCNQMPTQMYPANQQMNTMNNTSMNNRYGTEIDVSQLAGLESPTSMSSTEMQNTSGDQNTMQQHRQPQPPPQQMSQVLTDCAQQQQQQQQPQQQPFCNNQFTNQVPISYNCGTSYMDTVNQAMIANTGCTYMPVVSSTGFIPSNNITQVLIQQQQQQQQQQQPQQPAQTQRLTHNTTPCPPVNVQQQGGHQRGFSQNSCSLARLQQMTNGIMDNILPENQMTPPPQLTPPPSVTMSTPTSMIRNMQTPILSQQALQQQQQQHQQQQQQQQQQYQRQYQRQKSSSGSTSKQKSANVTVQPNVPFSPNVAIQPNTNMLPRYNTLMDGYRMQQPMLNTSYITNQGFINSLRQPPNIPMQMSLNMNNVMNPINPMNPMNMNPQQHFQQHMQPPQSNNVYTTYSYINPGLNMNMRR